MFSLKKLVLSEKMRLLMMVVFFGVFMYFSINIIIEEPAWVNRLLIIFVVTFFSVFFILSEILKYIYKQATRILVVNCNPDQALLHANKLKKLDIIKGYKNPLLVFYTLVYMDNGDYEALEKHIENPIFQSSSSLKLVYNYNKFYLAIHNEDLDQATEYFKLINDAYRKKTKRRYAAKPIYALSLIGADYYLLKKNYTKAEDGLRNVVPTSLNPREKTYYYISYAKFCKVKGLQKEILYVKDAQDIGPLLAHVKNYV